MTSSIANGQTKRTGYCLNDGEVDVTDEGKCLRCGKLAMNVVTQEALDRSRYKTDPAEIIDAVKSGFTASQFMKPAEDKTADKTVDVVILPDNQLSKRWIQNTQALIKSLSETKGRLESAIKSERKNLQRVDKALSTLTAQLSVYRVDDSKPSAPQPWAKEYARCIVCGTNEIKHKSLGRCIRCDGAARQGSSKVA